MNKVLFFYCPKCKKRNVLSHNDFFQHLSGKENEYIKIDRKCQKCKEPIIFVCKISFFCKNLQN